MKISTKGIYALEVVTDLAMHTGDGHPASIRSVAERRQLSEKYLERIVSLLRKGGIVRSERGAQGGYVLTKAPEELTVLEVLEAAEGCLAPVDCLINETTCRNDCSQCATRSVWWEIWKQLEQMAKKVTVSDLCRRAEEI